MRSQWGCDQIYPDTSINGSLSIIIINHYWSYQPILFIVINNKYIDHMIILMIKNDHYWLLINTSLSTVHLFPELPRHFNFCASILVACIGDVRWGGAWHFMGSENNLRQVEIWTKHYVYIICIYIYIHIHIHIYIIRVCVL